MIENRDTRQLGARLAVMAWFLICIPAVLIFAVSLALTIHAIAAGDLTMPLATGFLIATSCCVASICQAVMKVQEIRGKPAAAWDSWRFQAIASTFPSVGVLSISQGLEKQDVRALVAGGFPLILYLMFLFAPRKQE